MPCIQCDIRSGRSPEQVAALRDAVTKAVMDTIGSPRERVFVVIRESEGKHYFEGGEPTPEWTPDENPDWKGSTSALDA